MSDSLGGVTRPGISSEFLGRQGIRHVDEHEVEGQLGFKAGTGIWIPYPGLNSCVMLVNERPYGRLRLDRLPTAQNISRRGAVVRSYTFPKEFPSKRTSLSWKASSKHWLFARQVFGPLALAELQVQWSKGSLFLT
jgi:hypothetical protein